MPKKSLRDILRRNVTKLRKTQGLSQERCAELADISISLLQQIEHGRTWPSDATITKLAKAFKVEPTTLYVNDIETVALLLEVVLNQEKRLKAKTKINKS